MDACLTAGEALRRSFRRPVESQKKGDIDYVSEVDQRSQEIVRQTLGRRSQFPVVGEESGEPPTPEGTYWLVDPLDGTTNFLRGYPVFCVSIALVNAETVWVAAVYDPVHHELFTAQEGKGAWLNGAPISVARTESLGEAVLSTGFPYDAWTCNANPTEALEAFVRRVVTVRCDGAAALDLCQVAAGRIDGHWERGLGPWDVAAGSLIVREAGGTVTGERGEPFSLSAGSIAAGAAKVHAAMVEVLRSLG